ncbi:MAG: hypothetical protein IIY14_04970, partial [Bacteroidales bacterium]|nr:hypothetical protein [Bacteroidales bacterium]
ILTIGFQPRYSAQRQKVDAIIQSGELGKIYYIQSGGSSPRETLSPVSKRFRDGNTKPFPTFNPSDARSFSKSVSR